MNIYEQKLSDLFNKFIPIINKNIPKWIKDGGLDPWADVLSGTENIGTINLGICKAKAKASYKITNMKNLSSLVVLDDVALSNINVSDLSKVKGSLALNTKLNSSLSAKVSGTLKASCGIISESVKISGKITASGVKGSGRGDFMANLSSGACLTKVDVTHLTLDYSKIKVEIDGLGIFNVLLDPLVQLLDALFGNFIKKEIARALRPVLNDLMKTELPFCL